MPLWVSIELTKLIKDSLSNLERNILSYRAGGRGNLIINPKLPVKITPELDSIIINLMCDGCVSNVPSYFNEQNILTKSFLRRVKNCFGKFKFKTYKEKMYVRIPSAVSHILKHYYSISSFHSNLARIPQKIFEHSEVHRLACLAAFIADEGWIMDAIAIYSYNYLFIQDCKLLAESIGLACNPIHQHGREYYFKISNESVPLFVNKFLNMKKEHPTLTLGLLEKKLFNLLSITQNSIRRINMQHILLRLLKEPKTREEISIILKQPHSTIYENLRKLEFKNLIKHDGKQKAHIWYRI
jgi:hypothetical protein